MDTYTDIDGHLITSNDVALLVLPTAPDDNYMVFTDLQYTVCSIHIRTVCNMLYSHRTVYCMSHSQSYRTQYVVFTSYSILYVTLPVVQYSSVLYLQSYTVQYSVYCVLY